MAGKPVPLDPSRWTFPEPKIPSKELPDPPGFAFANEKNDMGAVARGANSNAGILEKQSWDVAITPGKSIFMNLFMLWMMGSGGIFAFIMVGYAVMQSFSSLMRVHDAFALFKGKIPVLLQKIVYVIINIAVLGYLCNHAANMGLFPINSGDWVASFGTSSIRETSLFLSSHFAQYFIQVITMLGAKVYRDYPVMREIVEDLDERFILGLDHDVLTDSKMIFFKIQKAFWYYKDKHERLFKDRKIPAMPLDMFGQLLIEESQLLSKIYPHDQRAARYRDWQDYLKRVPRLGAICLNPSGDKVLMIQPFGRNRKCLQFPRGKLHAGEDHAKAAAREVWEECGIRIENLMDESIFFESYIDQTLHKLYLVFPVMEELVPSIQCNKEIEQVLWFPVNNLPGWSNKSDSLDDRNFFGVAPFVPHIKAFIKRTFGSPSKKNQLPPIRILQRPTPEEFEESKEDPEADRVNAETFPEDHREGGWSFDAMMNANSKLGYTSTYSEEVFANTYNSPKADSGILDRSRIVKAFQEGWMSTQTKPRKI